MNNPSINQGTQMATPINTLPLKTTHDATIALDDPLIQNVLKEFEDDAYQSQPQEPQQPQQHQQPQQYQQPQQPQQYQQYQQPEQYQQHFQENKDIKYETQKDLLYNKSNKNIIDIDIVKKTAIIVIIVFLLQFNNIINTILSKLPETFQTFTAGKELIINLICLFIIFYLLFYFDLL
jgi:hypothetical protein